MNYDDLCSMSSVTKYVEYMNKLNAAGLEKNIPYILDSIQFIKQYCEEAGIPVSAYASAKHNNTIDVFWIHLKDRKISKYVTTLYPIIIKKILTSDFEETKYYLDDISYYNNVINEMDSNNEIKQKLNNKL